MVSKYIGAWTVFALVFAVAVTEIAFKLFVLVIY